MIKLPFSQRFRNEMHSCSSEFDYAATKDEGDCGRPTRQSHRRSNDELSLGMRSSYTIDMVKRALTHQIYLVSGKAPKISSVQLRQEWHHVAFTQPITCLTTLSPVQFVRTSPDA